MALPPGVTTATITYGKDSDILGMGVSVALTVSPSHTLIWAATGDRITAFDVETNAAEGILGSFELPHTDQPGFVDELGNSITDWYYTVFGRVSRGRDVKTYRKVFQLTSDQSSVDLDLLPINGTVGAVGSGPVPAVTSVNGMTGAVTVAGATGGGMLHTQAVPSASWVIAHSFARVPNVGVYVAGELVETDVAATSTTVTITFPTPTAGLAVLN